MMTDAMSIMQGKPMQVSGRRRAEDIRIVQAI
jgi:hypothetical protein